MAQPAGRRPLRCPSVSAMSWPCAQVSISRAVTEEAGPMSGPNHGQPGGRVDRRVSRRAAPRRAPRNQPSSSRGDRGGGSRAATRSGKSCPAAVSAAASRRNRSGSVTDEQGRLVEVREVADLVGDGPPGGRGRQLPLLRLAAARDRVQRGGLGEQVGEQRAGRSAAISGPSRPGARLSRKAAGPSWRPRWGRPAPRSAPPPSNASASWSAPTGRRCAWPPAPTAARWRRCARPAPARRRQFGVRDHLVDQPDLVGAGRADRVAGEQDLHRDTRRRPARTAAPPTARRGRPSPR